MKKIPVALIYLRLAIGIFLLALSFGDYNKTLFIALFAAGLLSDIFDGIIARRLGISDAQLRRLDSGIDQIFWCCVIAGIFIHSPAFLMQHYAEIAILAGLELAAYGISFVRFGKEVATHAISSKIWTLVLFATLVELIIRSDSGLLFQLCFYLGILTRLEIIAILLILKEWVHDVPSLPHAIKLRRGEEIGRNSLFNG